MMRLGWCELSLMWVVQNRSNLAIFLKKDLGKSSMMVLFLLDDS
jgi:hypothetical protein